MTAEKNKGTKKVFAVIYILLTVLLAYLLFFNTGIKIVAGTDFATGKKAVFIENATDRLINNITVKYKAGGAEKELAMIPELNPKEKKRIDTSAISQEKTVFIAQAPFHLGVQETIDLSPSSGRPIKAIVPETAETGKPFDFSLELCNYSNAEENVRVQELHEPIFFLAQNDDRSIALKPGECQKIEYSLVPGKKGDTIIYFNVNFPNSNEQFQRNVSVR